MVYSFRESRWITLLSLVGALFVLLPVCMAQSSELDALKAAVQGMQQDLQKALNRIEQLEKEKTIDSAKLGQVEKSVQAVQSGPSAFNPAIGFVLDSTVEHREKVGGDFNFRAAELGLSASVDPFARMYSFFTGPKMVLKSRRQRRLPRFYRGT
jgi:hypothetical protein